MKRFALCIVVVMSSVLGALAADVFQDYGLNRKLWAERFRWAITGSDFLMPEAAAKLRAVPPGSRAAVVNALGAAAKEYFGSAEFKAELKAKADQSGPKPPKPPRSEKEIADSMRAEIQKQIEAMDAMLKTLPAEARASAQGAVTAAREQLKTVDVMAKQMAQAEQQMYKAEKEEYDAHLKSAGAAGDGMAEARAGLKDALTRFLSETTAVNYDAKTAVRGGTRIFTSPGEESKPKAWKQCFRAGREACEAARTFATGWLKELK